MLKIKNIIYAALLIIPMLAPHTANALQVVTPTEGEAMFVNIAQGELNVIQFPFSGIRAYTSSTKIDIKVQSKEVLVQLTDPSLTKPQEVFFATPYGTYLLMLTPKSIPAETIIVKINKVQMEEAREWEKDSDYNTRLKELIKNLYTGNPPNGYALSTEKIDVSVWEGIEQTITITMVGAGLIGEVHSVSNHSKETVIIQESEFYKEGILAVSLTAHELRPGAKEQLYIVRRHLGGLKGADPRVRGPVVGSTTEAAKDEKND